MTMIRHATRWAGMVLGAIALLMLGVQVTAAQSPAATVDPALVATLLTAAGAPIAAAVVMAIVDVIKQIGLTRFVDGRERLWSLGLSIAVVVVATFVGLGERPPRYAFDALFLIGAALAVYNIFRLSLAMHDDRNRYPNSLTGPKVTPAEASRLP